VSGAPGRCCSRLTGRGYSGTGGTVCRTPHFGAGRQRHTRQIRVRRAPLTSRPPLASSPAGAIRRRCCLRRGTRRGRSLPPTARSPLPAHWALPARSLLPARSSPPLGVPCPFDVCPPRQAFPARWACLFCLPQPSTAAACSCSRARGPSFSPSDRVGLSAGALRQAQSRGDGVSTWKQGSHSRAVLSVPPLSFHRRGPLGRHYRCVVFAESWSATTL